MILHEETQNVASDHMHALTIRVEGGRELSKDEDTEIEMQLKLLNKPAVMTIETEYGDIYDCVDFYKQPAFDHPLLKNHSFHFQMKPTLRNREQVSSKARESVHTELKGGGCPVGTVPIRRITKEDLIRERDASKLMSTSADNTFLNHISVVRTNPGPDKFHGAGAMLSIHNPPVSQVQSSASRFVLQNGNDVIQAGWRVDPVLYGDHNTRRFIRIDAGQSHCYNTRCPGFVIVRSDKLLDLVYPISKPGGPVYEAPLWIDQDLVNGNWWLLVGVENTEVGFWPKRIFSGLADFASYADWGGQVSSTSGSTPQMGNGLLKGISTHDAYLSHIQVMNDRGQNVEVLFTRVLRTRPANEHRIISNNLDFENIENYTEVPVHKEPYLDPTGRHYQNPRLRITWRCFGLTEDMAFVTLPGEEYTTSLSCTQLMTLLDSAPVDPTPSQYHPFTVPAAPPVVMYQPGLVYDQDLGCNLYEIPVMEQLPPLPAPIEPTYQFDLAMTDLAPFNAEPYCFEIPVLEPLVEEPPLTPDQVFDQIMQRHEIELTMAERAHGEALKAYFQIP
ncbi:hypothetical protein Vadar_021958 [Vaccinium darrowii]|uniref:Uncharacterized protein n=1 Tax=Vaccinium darrowii TaxID=229202 RepID=A0ACB7XJH5_9ERIC|nr:hypothetical protein Vadar_021958 [Vaccinium darrowii]